MILSVLESKILLWKVNFHIYFPQWQVMSKVSVEPPNGHICTVICSKINQWNSHKGWFVNVLEVHYGIFLPNNLRIKATGS